MTELIDATTENLSKLETLIQAAIEKCNTHSHRAKDIAKDLRYNGFDGQLAADLIRELDSASKFGHLYQAYINVQNSEEE